MRWQTEKKIFFLSLSLSHTHTQTHTHAHTYISGLECWAQKNMRWQTEEQIFSHSLPHTHTHAHTRKHIHIRTGMLGTKKHAMANRRKNTFNLRSPCTHIHTRTNTHANTHTHTHNSPLTHHTYRHHACTCALSWSHSNL